MPVVTVGVQRNNIWSLKFNEYTNILIPDLEYQSLELVREQLQNFAKQTEFRIGFLKLSQRSANTWLATFPGLHLSFSTCIICENGPVTENMPLQCTDEDVRMLLEFVTHMFPKDE